jgi:N-acetylglucosamine-6-phosphate deacetylase
VAVVLEGAKIGSVSRNFDAARMGNGAEVIDVRPGWLAPGYVDVHTHGFAGHDVTDIEAMAAALPSTGVTAFCPTIASTGPKETEEQVKRIAQAMQSGGPAAEIIGIRLEGPFISRAKKGAQAEAAIRPPDVAELERLASSGPIRIVDFAPEEDGDQALLGALVGHGIVPAIGHTACTYDQAIAAVDAGARHCTHLFNAMPVLEHRAPGPAAALLTDARATVELIADGVHVHAAVLSLVVVARGPRSIALVTDAMHAAGLPDGAYDFLGQPVHVRDGAVRLADGTLAGSVLTLDCGVRNMVALAGVSWSDAIRMASEVPAQIIGVADRKGRIAAGADADLVVLDEHGTVRQTWRAGRQIFSA